MTVPRDEFARDRKSEVVEYLTQALNAANHDYWSQCRLKTELALDSARQWEEAADDWSKWP